MLKKILLKMLSSSQKIRWNIEKLRSPKCAIEIPEITLKGEDRLLVLAPHADDELIGCHSLMLCNISRTTIVYCSFLGSNSDIQNRKIREKEFKSYMKALNTTSYFISSPNHLSEDIFKTINNIKPTIIALPSYIDWHPEHRIVNEILLERKNIISNVRILWYHLSLPIPVDYINRVIWMDSQQHSLKWKSFSSSYESQLHIDTERFAFIEGLYCRNDRFIESFYEQNVESWMNNIYKLKKETSSMYKLKKSLGNIRKMVNHTAKFYSMLDD